MASNFKSSYPKGPSSPENSSGSSRSIQPSPTSATPRPPSRVVDEDYDEGGVAHALIGLAGLGNSASGADAPSHSPTISSHSRLSDPSPRPPPSHRNSISSNHASPPTQPTSGKRPLSPGPEDSENNKRSRMDMTKRRISSPTNGKPTPVPSSRPSPIPFRTQPASHSPEARDPYPHPPSPPLPVVLPPHPRPVGNHAQSLASSAPPPASSIALPPIATLSPPSTAPSPTNHNDDKMHVDSARSSSPPSASRGKLSEVMHPSSRSPTVKQSQSPPSEKKEP
ncbi:hypothetical protein CPB84DRAFT_1848368 [Gymnopilus junonius]|uniref:Uncharacterized protein n=1 Tax=Gymnopilus junonius TaxID=109634 RepID=A0A9P5TKZ2_GYMJU|nr:hypothetical protein CPB84DRAFT_1848368 [Gymnopilus junonius]